MAWLGGRVKWPFGGNGVAVAELEVEPEIEVVDDGLPHLMMLAADASGLASFKLLNFADAETAIEFIQRSFGDRSDTGLIAFWAMTEKPVVSPQPGADTALEVMVMIRDDIRNEVVYPFSFTDMEAAQSFVRHEMERGLEPGHVLLYWAVPVQLGISADGSLGLFPKAAPTIVDPETHEVTHAPVTEQADEQDQAGDFLQSLSVNVQTEETFVATEDDPIEALFESADEPVAEPTVEISEFVEDEIEESAGGGDETRIEAVEDCEEAIDGEDEDAAADGVEDVVAEFAEDGEPEAAEDAAAEEEIEVMDVEVIVEESVDFEQDAVDEPPETTVTEETKAQDDTDVLDVEVTADEEFDLDQGAHHETSAAAEPAAAEEPLAAIAARLPMADEPIGTEFPAGRAHARSESEPNSVSDQLQRVLRVRRWEETTEPFRGFQSPPGRF